MATITIPAKFQEIWAIHANPLYITTPIPQTSTDPTRASQDLGFPPDTQVSVDAGGTPPHIADFNGVLNMLSAWSQWFSAGAPVFFDGTFASNIGGYPQGSIVAATANNGNFYFNTVNGNLTDPNGGSSVGWTSFTFIGLAPLDSPHFINLPLAPTAPPGTNDTQIATTAFATTVTTNQVNAEASTRASADTVLQGNINIVASGLATETARAEAAEALLAPINNPTLTGNIGVGTRSPGDSTVNAASTAFVQAANTALANSLRQVPIGGIMMWPAAAPPTGFLELNGQTNAVSSFPALAAVFGFFSGNFTLPDMRGQFARGWDHGAGVDPSRSLLSTQGDQMIAHTHTVAFSSNNSGGGVPGHGGPADASEASGSAGAGTETRPKNVAVMFIIKY